ncbi:MAG: hypothetical protein ABI678_04645 [Kofleriaceae bacterium]
MKTWLLAFALAGLVAGCKDASKDLEALSGRCHKCKDDKDPKACATQVIDDFVTYAKANPNPRGNEQNAAAQFADMTKCAMDLGVDVNTLLTKTKSL